MVRGLVVCIAMCFVVAPAFADPKIDSAISVFKKTEADATKLVTFCAMSQAMAAAGENEDPATKAEIDEDLKQLGPDFETAWSVFKETDQNSPEGKALNKAVDELGGNCPD